MTTKKLHLPSDVKTLGDAVRWLREQRGMTLRALAKKVDVTAPFLSDLEHNRRKTDKLEEIAKALDFDFEELQEFDGRLTADLKEWIDANPGMVTLLKDIRASGRSTEELRATFVRPRR